MARMGSFDASQMRKLQQNLEKLQGANIDAFCEECAKELAQRLIRKVVKRTPVGDYSGYSYTCASGQGHKGHKVPGKVGGTLRRGWTTAMNNISVQHVGSDYKIEIVNPVEYASYVEYGHRTRNHSGWVPGHFMMTISEQEIQDMAPRILENKLKKFLGGVFQ